MTRELKVSNQSAPVKAPVMDEVVNRWSPRAFDGEPISREVLQSLFEAARWSASAYNEQPWRFVAASRNEAGFEALLGCLNEWNRSWADTAGALIMVAARKAYTHNEKENAHARYDAGQAAAWLSAQAVHMGLQVHQMAGFSEDAARMTLAIPDEFEPVSFIAVGKVGDPASLPESMRKMEEAPRTRRPIEETVFYETWGKPHPLVDIEEK